MPDQREGSQLLPACIENNSNDEWPVPSAAVSPNLHSPIFKTSQYITLSYAGHHSTRMRCYFYSQQNCFLDYFNYPVLDGAVTYVGDIPFQYSEKQGTCAKVLNSPSGNIFLATSRDHEFLQSYRNSVLHTSDKSRRFSHNYIKNPSSRTTHYHLLIPVTHYIQHTVTEKEIPRQNMSN